MNPGKGGAFPGDLALRPVKAEDWGFLLELYSSTRCAEMALSGWNDEQKRLLIESQFDAQRRHYEYAYVGAEHLVVLAEGERIGRYYVQRQPEKIHIIDISLMPQWRNRGIGSKMLGQILTEAALTGKKVSLNVERFNPALNLYRRLGFQVADESDKIRLYMERLPAAILK